MMNNLTELAVQRKLVKLIGYSHCKGMVNMAGILRACRDGVDALTDYLVRDGACDGMAFSVAQTIHRAWEKSPRLNGTLAWFMLDWPYDTDVAHRCRDVVDRFVHEGGFQQLHTVLVSAPYEGERLLEAERFVDDIVPPNYRHPLEHVPSFAAIRNWCTRLWDPGFYVREFIGPSFGLDTVFALADVAMSFPNGWTGRLGVHAQLEYAETLMEAWCNWFIEKGYAVAGQPGLGNAVDELYECSPFVW